ncbi:hypothetical protein GLOIN_2v1848400 [Rhizophagus irregularis DAOM 181602=DAOM 197198]|nr:hypothetical protein GLOIN_2v1848400 [Rhizophagus irregularis DAOM 181602=DAOM 197198]
MRNLRSNSNRKVKDQQDIESIIDKFETNKNSTSNNEKKKRKTFMQKVNKPIYSSESQIPIVVEDKNKNSPRLTLVDINRNQIHTSVTNQNINEGKKKSEWWEQFVEYGVKEIINDCLYPKEETLSLHIKKHLAKRLVHIVIHIAEAYLEQYVGICGHV